ncbi:hypothetical protein PC39_16171 [Salinisphaera sp. PC39]|uniref:DUF2924 domain-containing protein n=1 Tax=Salinisphaera sp. PC39 TaxID=1304156 RepID=UPI003341A12E
MMKIDIDFEVFKELTMLRESEEVTENQVIRRLLGLDEEAGPMRASKSDGVGDEEGIPWVVKNVYFPHGTQFRKVYKGREYLGTVKNGALELEGKRYTSPSAAAVSVTGINTNGWRFWECKRPSETTWRLMETYRT